MGFMLRRFRRTTPFPLPAIAVVWLMIVALAVFAALNPAPPPHVQEDVQLRYAERIAAALAESRADDALALIAEYRAADAAPPATLLLTEADALMIAGRFEDAATLYEEALSSLALPEKARATAYARLNLATAIASRDRSAFPRDLAPAPVGGAEGAD